MASKIQIIWNDIRKNTTELDVLILWLITIIYNCILLLFVHSYRGNCFCFRFYLFWDSLSYNSGWYWTCYVAETNHELLIHLPSTVITSVCHQTGYFGTLVSDKNNPKFTSYKGSHSYLLGASCQEEEETSAEPQMSKSPPKKLLSGNEYFKTKTKLFSMGLREVWASFLKTLYFYHLTITLGLHKKCPRLRLSQRDRSKVIFFHNEAEDIF